MFVVPHIDHHPSVNEFNADIRVFKLGNNFSLTKCCDEDVVVQCQRCRSYQTSVDGGKRRKTKPEVAEMQSTDIPISTPTPAEVVAENLVFKDENLSEVLEIKGTPHGPYDADEDVTAALGNFLSRPVRIANVTWTNATSTPTTLAPWNLYFNTSQIKNKLQNYGRISCKLHLKFIVNASPFYYGCMRACYFPIPDARSNYTNVVDQIPFSQTPGVFIEPQTMTSAEMILPFLWQDNWLDLTVASQFTNMGKLQLLPYASLRSANGLATASITIGVYAWAEDVQLMGPTTIAAMQSDEYSLKGAVSAPASAIAAVANKVTDIPFIGPFARATEVGAKAISSVAKIFGYSNPPEISSVVAFQPRAFHALANVDQSVALDKLCLDPKNEVAMGSATVGIDEDDPLTFEATCGHESFLFGTNWSDADSNDALLASALVNPTYVVAGGGYFVTPPVSYFSIPYRLWRGSLIYRFKFIKSKYHKGRVLISYDPAGDITATSDTETTTFTRVVDISVEDEVEIEIPYKATSPWLTVAPFVNGTNYWSNGASPTYSYLVGSHNGSWSIRVQNVLTGPAASPEMDILVFVRAGKDFQLSVPKNLPGYFLHGPDATIQSEDIALDNPTLNSEISALTVGEHFRSHRPLMHRTNTSGVYTLSPDGAQAAGTFIASLALPRYPYWAGRNPNAAFTGTISAVTQTVHFGETHPLTWFTNCFVGKRGSTNIHVNAIPGANSSTLDSMRLDRYFSSTKPSGVIPYNLTTTYVDMSTTSNANETAANFWSSRPAGMQGGALTNTRTQAGLSVNVPQYAPWKFAKAFGELDIKDARGTDFDDNVLLSVVYTTNSAKDTTKVPPMVEVLYSAGVDYQVFQFLCTPRLFSYSIGSI